MLGILVPLICFSIYLISNNAAKDFIDYTILGLKTFSNKIEYITLFKQPIIAILAIIVPITMIITFILLFKRKTINQLYPLFAYSISSFIVTFPISDKIHFAIGSVITFILGIYLIYEFIIKKFTEKLKIKTKIILYGIISFLIIFVILIIFYNSLKNIDRNYIKADKETELAHFINTPENKGLKERITYIDSYIKKQKEEGKKVYILDAEAAIYNIPLDIYNKDYDMFNKGNLGAKDEEGIIERIEKEDAIYLIKKGNLNWQNPNKVRKYIIENLKQKGELSIFLIYEKGE